ncbi:MAG: orotidine-5'-phosphate decarboxylase [Patescibacteria group bacterium]
MLLNRMVLALDDMEPDQIGELIAALAHNDLLPWSFKVNDRWVESGKQTVPMLRLAAGGAHVRVLADLKLSDTPKTMSASARRVREAGAVALTIHASCGLDSIKAALEHGPAEIIAVTLLTSINRMNCLALYGREPIEQVKIFAKYALESGVGNLVCSGEEVATLHEMYPGIGLLVPGVRMPGSDLRGQKRITTPWDAFNNGATRIVVGSEVTMAKDPVATFENLLAETEKHVEF